jgi:tensin
MGILRTQEDSRPLVHNKSSSITSSDSIQTISDGYVNEAICDSDKIVSNKFGDSCRQAFNHQTYHMQPLSSSLSNPIPLNTLNLKKNVITTSATVHASDKSTNLSYNYNETNFCEFDYKKSFNSTAPSSPNGSDKRSSVPPILPLRNDALSIPEQNDLKNCSWFQAGLPREISLEILTRQNPGAFLVRQSESKMGCFALSLRVPPPAPAKVAHYLILRTQRGGYKIKVSIMRFKFIKGIFSINYNFPRFSLSLVFLIFAT